MKKFTNSCLLLILLFCFSFKSKSQCGLFFFPSYVYNCATGQGVVSGTINGGAVPYTYTFVNVSNASVAIGAATGNSVSVPGITPGPYTIYLTSNNCTQAFYFSLISPISSANIVFSNTMVTCPSGNNGASLAGIVPGPLTPPYSFTWSSGSFSQAATNLSAGVYTVTVQDNIGCIVSNTVQITQPNPINSNFTNTLITCYGGSLTTVITTTGGTSPFTYTMNGNALGSNTVSGLTVGVKTITTSDSQGCLKTNTVMISQVVPPTITFSVTKPLCPGSSNGAVYSSVSNAPPALSYTWQPTVSFTSSITNIPIGTYTLTVKDGSACTTKSVIVVTPANSLSATVSTNSENCSAADGAFTINMSGGTSPYTYSTISVGNSTSNILTGLSSGVYTTIVTDGSNCKDTVKLIIGNLSTVSVTIVDSNPVLCYNQCTGSVQVSVQNGIPPITYSATGTPTTLSNNITNLCAGLITIKVIDNIGCPATTTVNFPVPPVFSFSATNPPSVCFGKTFTLQGNASGGSGGYNFVWNPGNVTGQTVSLTSSATTVYSLNVYDSNGCTLPPYTVTVNVNPAISININSSNSGICPGTTAQISPTVSGGDGNYTYNWVPGNLTGSFIFVENISVPVYTLSVNDGCGSPTAIKVVTINLFPAVIPTFSIASNTGCEPFCTQFISTTPKATNVIWNYGDKPFEQMGNTTDYCYTKSGYFNLRITVNDSNSCKAAHTYSNVVHVLKKPVAAFITDPATVTTNDLENVLIKNSSTFSSNYSWYVNGVSWAQTTNINYSFPDTGCVNFRLIATNEDNCRDTLDKPICVIEGFNFWIPNAFSPNADGMNDIFLPQGTAWLEKNYVFEIYNRWGKRIFKTNDVSAGWDGATKGEVDPFNRYYWHVTVTDILDKSHDFKGFVLVLK